MLLNVLRGPAHLDRGFMCPLLLSLLLYRSRLEGDEVLDNGASQGMEYMEEHIVVALNEL